MTVSPIAPTWLQHPDDANALDAAVWPRNAARDASGEITVAGVSASALAERFGTPLYVIDEADARGRARGIRDAFAAEAAARYVRAGSAP